MLLSCVPRGYGMDSFLTAVVVPPGELWPDHGPAVACAPQATAGIGGQCQSADVTVTRGATRSAREPVTLVKVVKRTLIKA